MSKIDPTARIEDGAVIGEGVTIGPYCVIGPNVTIGADCNLQAHVSISGHTTLGAGCKVFPFASLGGAPQNPVWYHNLKKNPHVELQDGAVKKDYLAREVSGDEYKLWWDRAVDAFPDYADYQKKTERIIPVFVLTEMTGE